MLSTSYPTYNPSTPFFGTLPFGRKAQMLLFAGTYRSFVCGLHASGTQSFPPPMLGQNSAPCVTPGRFDSSTTGLPVFASIDVKTFLCESDKAWRMFYGPGSHPTIHKYSFQLSCV